MIGTSDRLCWLAESCKILLLLIINHNRRRYIQNCRAMQYQHEHQPASELYIAKAHSDTADSNAVQE